MVKISEMLLDFISDILTPKAWCCMAQLTVVAQIFGSRKWTSSSDLKEPGHQSNLSLCLFNLGGDLSQVPRSSLVIHHDPKYLNSWVIVMYTPILCCEQENLLIIYLSTMTLLYSSAWRLGGNYMISVLESLSLRLMYIQSPNS